MLTLPELYPLVLGWLQAMEAPGGRTAVGALAHLVAMLRRGGFALLDVQFVTPHLKRFGAVEIPRAEYHQHLAAALQRKVHFPAGLDGAAVAAILQSSTLTL